MNRFSWAVLLLLCAILVLQTCNYINSVADKKDYERSDTLYLQSNDHWHEVPFKVEVPVPYRVEVPGTPGQTITIPPVIDSLAVVIDYYTKRHYLDSLKNDSIEIRLSATVFKNQLTQRSLSYKWIAKTMVIEKTKAVNRQLVFLGADITGNAGHFGLYPSVYFDTKKAMFGFGYDVVNHYYKVGAYGKLKLWKRRN